jgi:predicted metal-binding membrane protein
LPWLLVAIAATAVVGLLAWGASPYARYMSHAYQPASALGQAGAMTLFLAVWVLMIAAMMLPATLGLLRAFTTMTRRRGDARRLLLRVEAGFLVVWISVGFAFRALDIGVHSLVDATAFLRERPQLIGASALLLAGAFQFTPLKRRCLTACRSPASFLYSDWHGVYPAHDALRIGTAYGASCVGCCWALMLVVFGLGAGSIAWMAAIWAAMAAERSLVLYRDLTAPLGVGLLFAGAWVAVVG